MILIALLAVFLCTPPAYALDVHPDYRFAYGSCPTWGSGTFSEAKTFIRMKEVWSTSVSNYPVDWGAKIECQYKGQSAPMAKPGEYIVPGNLCKPKKVIPKICANGPNVDKKCASNADCPEGACVAGTQPATSWPVAYIWCSMDYNGGGISFPSGCKWDPWAYGAPPAP